MHTTNSLHTTNNVHTMNNVHITNNIHTTNNVRTTATRAEEAQTTRLSSLEGYVCHEAWVRKSAHYALNALMRLPPVWLLMFYCNVHAKRCGEVHHGNANIDERRGNVENNVAEEVVDAVAATFHHP